ncbi:NAD(+) diphosphatase [Chitinimonas koreensis]|uniref:NAD(+) diphosphatase n=1 Tax=Chitinimonas koreensis TaxID=356302 RepID=UPI0003FA036F|nr:NAD(+) diphosphatase [Chitinimonas koreensis]QNM94959.1 NAD(+) diphosphatase [Chitinimonas koreensis]
MAVFQPSIRPVEPASEQVWRFAFVAGRFLVREAETIELAPLAWPEFAAAAADAHYLGRLEGRDCWACTLEAEPAGWRAVPLRSAMMGLDAPLMMLAARAAQVIEWDRAHRFCGACGTPTERMEAERARACPACRQVAYPRLSPAMMALVWRGEEVLLARSPGFTPGVFSALAGFVEPGESVEECVAREVMEEVGVRVDRLRYYGSQSWPFPHSLMLAYTAEWVGGEIVPQPGEIEEAGWFHIDALPGIPPRFSIAGHLIRDSVAAMRAGRSLR